MIERGELQGILGVMIPIVAIVGGLSLGFAGFYWRNRERMEMISRGMDISDMSERERRGKKRSPLRTGLILLGAGIGLLSAYILCHSTLIDANSRDDQNVIYIGFVATFIGLGLLLTHLMEKKEPTDTGTL